MPQRDIKPVIDYLSSLGVIFCGGYAEYLYGVKTLDKVKDIDILVNTDILQKIEHMVNNDGIDWGENVKGRYEYPILGYMVDMWLVNEMLNYNMLNNLKVQTLEGIIDSKKTAILNNKFKNEKQKAKLEQSLKSINLKYLNDV